MSYINPAVSLFWPTVNSKLWVANYLLIMHIIIYYISGGFQNVFFSYNRKVKIISQMFVLEPQLTRR